MGNRNFGGFGFLCAADETATATPVPPATPAPVAAAAAAPAAAAPAPKYKCIDDLPISPEEKAALKKRGSRNMWAWFGIGVGTGAALGVGGTLGVQAVLAPAKAVLPAVPAPGANNVVEFKTGT
jgi:hypothetical protein